MRGHEVPMLSAKVEGGPKVARREVRKVSRIPMCEASSEEAL